MTFMAVTQFPFYQCIHNHRIFQFHCPHCNNVFMKSPQGENAMSVPGKGFHHKHLSGFISGVHLLTTQFPWVMSTNWYTRGRHALTHTQTPGPRFTVSLHGTHRVWCEGTTKAIDSLCQRQLNSSYFSSFFSHTQRSIL